MSMKGARFTSFTENKNCIWVEELGLVRKQERGGFTSIVISWKWLPLQMPRSVQPQNLVKACACYLQAFQNNCMGVHLWSHRQKRIIARLNCHGVERWKKNGPFETTNGVQQLVQGKLNFNFAEGTNQPHALKLVDEESIIVAGWALQHSLVL